MNFSANRKALRFLLVDDDQMQHLISERLFTQCHAAIELTCATSVDEALEQLKVETFDLVITDLNMPEKTGWDLLQQLQQQNANIPVIVVSSSLDERDTQRSTRYDSVLSYIPKPLDLPRVSNVLQQLQASTTLYAA